MFMLTSTHERILQEERKNFSDACRTLAENRKQQILLYEEQVLSNIARELGLMLGKYI